MARPLIEVKVGEECLTAVLDTVSRRSYIRQDIALKMKLPKTITEPSETKLGGEVLIKNGYLVYGTVKDNFGKYKFSTILFPAKELGFENNKRIDILFGAIILEDWGACIDESTFPPKVEFTILRKGELIEL